MATNIQVVTFRNVTVTLLCFLCFCSYGQENTLQNSNKKTITRYFDEVMNGHNLSRTEDFFALDYIWHQMNGTDVRSNVDSSHISTLRWLFTAIPDIHYSIEQMVAEDDLVAVNTTWTGTARSEMFGLPPAKKKVRYKQMFFYRLKDNKIIEQWEVVDAGGLKTELEEKW